MQIWKSCPNGLPNCITPMKQQQPKRNWTMSKVDGVPDELVDILTALPKELQAKIVEQAICSSALYAFIEGQGGEITIPAPRITDWILDKITLDVKVDPALETVTISCCKISSITSSKEIIPSKT